MQILRMLLERPHRKISYWKSHLETVICRMLASRLKFICLIQLPILCKSLSFSYNNAEGSDSIFL